jgi:hypothetical protein
MGTAAWRNVGVGGKPEPWKLTGNTICKIRRGKNKDKEMKQKEKHRTNKNKNEVPNEYQGDTVHALQEREETAFIRADMGPTVKINEPEYMAQHLRRQSS